MTLHCAECPSFVCRGGNREAGPEHCPMQGEFPAFRELYQDEATLRLAVGAALVEAEGYCRWTRLREVGEFSRSLGLVRLGIGHCPDMAPEAARVADYLAGFGLEPFLPASSADHAPLAQARELADLRTDLNLLAGMCVGHEAMFVKASQAPVISLVARDARLRHNPVAALYTSRSYLKDDVFGHWSTAERPAFKGWEMDTLEQATGQALLRGGDNRSRVAEAMEVAHALGASHVGITFCVGFREEASLLTGILETNGFRVSSVCCKTGAVPKEEAGIRDHQKVRPGRPEMICNPLAQAELLNREGVQFALSLGQCVGHEAATLGHLRAPAACLVAKDRVLAHNTVAGLP